MDVTHAIQDARLRLASNISVTFTFDKIVNTLSHATYQIIDKSVIPEHDWKDLYGDVKEVIPSNAPEPLNKEVMTHCFVDADHAGDKLPGHSCPNFIIHINSAPIVWYSKRQETIETSTFGSEFVSAKVATKMIRGLRYKLRMMGIPIDGPTLIFGDNIRQVELKSGIPDQSRAKCDILYCNFREI
jgi:hypothetical protein